MILQKFKKIEKNGRKSAEKLKFPVDLSMELIIGKLNMNGTIWD
jgi:hypothetical protein